MQPVNPSLRLQILVISAARTVLNIMHRMVYPFLPVFQRAFGVDLTTLSLAMTARSGLGALSPLLASFSETRGRKAGMLLGMLLFIIGVGVVIVWPVFPAFVAALLLCVTGKYVFDPAMQAYVGDRVPYQRRGLALAVTEMSWSLAFIIGMPAVAFLLARSGWMAPFPLLIILGVVSMAGLAWLVPADRRTDRPAQGITGNLSQVFRSLPALTGLAMGVMISSANEVVNLVFGVWMEDSFGLKIAALGAASVVIGVSELGGEALVGWQSDRLGKARAVGIGLAMNSLAVLSLPLIGRSLVGALAGLFLFYLTFEFTLVSSIPLMTEVLPESRATLMALNVTGLMLGRAMGASLAPFIYDFGILASAATAVVFNLLALAALRALKTRLAVEHTA